jgi:hypothetical protein
MSRVLVKHGTALQISEDGLITVVASFLDELHPVRQSLPALSSDCRAIQLHEEFLGIAELVCEAFHGELRPGEPLEYMVYHLDLDPYNFHQRNLRWVRRRAPRQSKNPVRPLPSMLSVAQLTADRSSILTVFTSTIDAAVTLGLDPVMVRWLVDPNNDDRSRALKTALGYTLQFVKDINRARLEGGVVDPIKLERLQYANC